MDAVIDVDGNVGLQLLLNYLQKQMPPEQQPSLSGDSAGRGRECILSCYPERAATLYRRRQRPGTGAERPTSYIPFPRNHFFRERPGEFARLEALLFGTETQGKTARLGLVGVIGLGGVGKTQLAVELAYRCLDQLRFPGGIFWMPATGTTVYDWQRHLADLAFNADYLPPPEDDPASPENEARRARYFSRYLATHADALLILDNVEAPDLVGSALPQLAGRELACALLYTSRLASAGASMACPWP